jgi:hypothetical protein
MTTSKHSPVGFSYNLIFSRLRKEYAESSVKVGAEFLKIATQTETK